jgi:hypothetical protein
MVVGYKMNSEDMRDYGKLALLTGGLVGGCCLIGYLLHSAPLSKLEREIKSHPERAYLEDPIVKRILSIRRVAR